MTDWTMMESVTERIEHRTRARATNALGPNLASAQPNQSLQPFWHWFYFLSMHDGTEIGSDGHPRHPYAPPGFKRRMFGGARIEVSSPIAIGSVVTKSTSYSSPTVKNGRSGELAIVTLRSELSQNGEILATEEQDLIYVNGPPGHPREGTRSPKDSHSVKSLAFDEVTLFRFSALTYNSHRIHYDKHYATAVEGLPDLVVQGPLIGLLLSNWLGSTTDQPLTKIEFRSLAPVYLKDTLELSVSHDGSTSTAEAWTQDNVLAMQATAQSLE